jgi:uncharacterized protein
MNIDHNPSMAAHYRAQTPWSWWAGVLASVLIMAAAIVLSVGATLVLAELFPGTLNDKAGIVISLPMLLLQLTTVLGAVWLAGWYQGGRWQVLALGPSAWSMRALAGAFLLMTVLSLVYSLLIYKLYPDVVRADVASFLPLVRSAAWPLFAVIIVVGAPLSEELLFRGYLQSALAKSRLGFVGASLISTTLWTGLHVQYSAFGLLEIFVVGLFLCWVLWRTGSLWATIILHGLFNGIQFVAMRYSLLPWT